LLNEITGDNIITSKDSFAMMCANWFNCLDFKDNLVKLQKPGTFMRKDVPKGIEAQATLLNCFNYLNKQMQKDEPWKITEEFIYNLGFNFGMFRVMNSLYLSG
jgi:hypothetical protein